MGKQVVTQIASKTPATENVAINMNEFSKSWGIMIETTSLDAADATVTIQGSHSTSGGWIQYSDNSALTLPTTGVVAFEDNHCTWPYLRLVVDKGSVTSGTFIVTGVFEE